MKLDRSKVHLSMKDLSPEIRVFVDKGQIQQALLNLILNALGAMSGGGDLRIEGEELEEERFLFMLVILVLEFPRVEGKNFRFLFDWYIRRDRSGVNDLKRSRAHDGDLELVESGEGGTTFKLTLPVSFSDQTS